MCEWEPELLPLDTDAQRDLGVVVGLETLVDFTLNVDCSQQRQNVDEMKSPRSSPPPP